MTHIIQQHRALKILGSNSSTTWRVPAQIYRRLQRVCQRRSLTSILLKRGGHPDTHPTTHPTTHPKRLVDEQVSIGQLGLNRPLCCPCVSWSNLRRQTTIRTSGVLGILFFKSQLVFRLQLYEVLIVSLLSRVYLGSTHPREMPCAKTHRLLHACCHLLEGATTRETLFVPVARLAYPRPH